MSTLAADSTRCRFRGIGPAAAHAPLAHDPYDLEVSGVGAAEPFRLESDAWRWEDLETSTMHPVGHYRLYRGLPGGVFSCIFTTPDTEWPGGDPSMPPTGTVLAYVVTAVGPGGAETHGVAPPQTLDPAGCP